MPTIKARVIPHNPEDEHILRRLGKAIAIHWDLLSEIDQVSIIAQAGMIEDEYVTVQLKEQINSFIERHRNIGKS